jgi:hypothetical protein
VRPRGVHRDGRGAVLSLEADPHSGGKVIRDANIKPE